MMRDLVGLVPEDQRRLLPGYAAAVLVMGVAQGLAYTALAPLLEAFFSGDDVLAWRWTIGVLGALVVVAISSHLQALAALRIGIAMMHDLQTRLGDHLGALPLGWFSRSSAGSASRVIISSTNEVLAVFAHLLTPVLAAVITPAVVALAMLAIDWRVSLAMVISAPLLLLVNRWGNRLYGHSTEVQHDAAARANEQVIEFAQAQAVLRVFGSDAGHERQLHGALEGQRRAIRGALWASVPGLAVFAAVVQMTFMLLAWVILTLATGGDLSAPMAIALLAVSARFVEPLNQAAEMGSAIRRASTAAGRIIGLLDTPAAPEPADPVAPRGAGVRFAGVSFGYRPGETILDGVDFTVPEGSTTAIVGPSGSGKTTILRLAARFFDPHEGAVEIGDVPLPQVGTAATLAQVAPVFQDVYLFDDTVWANVRVGDPDATDDRVRAAAAVARVDEVVRRLPDGWDTQVGEGGASLSGGERQRVSVARALLKDAPIALLDEATSSLDPQNEAAVVGAIRQLTNDRTVLVVAHRLSTIRHADQILFVDAGRVVERGTHEDLLALGGRYATFWAQRDRAAGWRLESVER